MPRVRSWSARIPLILQHLETDAQAVYTRSEVQALFQIGRSQAVDLMKIAGAEVRNGAEASVSRDNLRWYVERCPEAQAYLDEKARQERLAVKLRDATAAKRVGAAVHQRRKQGEQWTRFEDLADISIGDGKLTILFSSAEDLAYKLCQLAIAEANEPDVFDQMCEGR